MQIISSPHRPPGLALGTVPLSPRGSPSSWSGLSRLALSGKHPSQLAQRPQLNSLLQKLWPHRRAQVAHPCSTPGATRPQCPFCFRGFLCPEGRSAAVPAPRWSQTARRAQTEGRRTQGGGRRAGTARRAPSGPRGLTVSHPAPTSRGQGGASRGRVPSAGLRAHGSRGLGPGTPRTDVSRPRTPKGRMARPETPSRAIRTCPARESRLRAQTHLRCPAAAPRPARRARPAPAPGP